MPKHREQHRIGLYVPLDRYMKLKKKLKREVIVMAEVKGSLLGNL